MDIKELFRKEINKRSVFKNKEYISPHYVPDMLPFRDLQIQDVITNFAPVLQNNRPNNIFIYGKSGTGKTATINKVLEKMLEIQKESNLEQKILTIYMNCRTYNSKYKVLLKISDHLFPKSYFGYSASYIYDLILKELQEKGIFIILVLDEVDLIKDVNDTIYSLVRINDELKQGSITLVGISNNVLFKDSLDSRTKSGLCKKELLFPPYNAKELQEILKQRIPMSFVESAVDDSAIALASAYAAQESGDARTALLLLESAGELADKNETYYLTESEIKDAKKQVEEEIIIEMLSTLPDQIKVVLYSIATMVKNKRFSTHLLSDGHVIYSGDAYLEYVKQIKQLSKMPVSMKWFKQYLEELNTYGFLTTTTSGKGVRGSTTLIKMVIDSNTVLKVLENNL
jgi:cell division control protein 6